MAAVESIFVYGSLRKGMAQHALLADARFLGPAATQPEFTLLDTGHWPAAITGGRTSIIGEMYEVTAKRLAAIDHYERHPSYFCRNKVVLADSREAWMWIYVSEIQRQWQPLDHGSWHQG